MSPKENLLGPKTGHWIFLIFNQFKKYYNKTNKRKKHFKWFFFFKKKKERQYYIQRTLRAIGIYSKRPIWPLVTLVLYKIKKMQQWSWQKHFIAVISDSSDKKERINFVKGQLWYLHSTIIIESQTLRYFWMSTQIVGE